ncbi:uncharacterized protein LOC134509456 [Chroicocephalus ridibundus]|uniref:uncharacterized protein LOC134509456 n=1 Tax=Chroicocephalus ridibundus TaxID=1192867 RepID=UPI002FDDE010
MLLALLGSRPPPEPFPFPLPPPEPLPTPTLSPDAGYDLYYEGERVTVVCSAPTARNIAGFRLFNQTGQQIDLRRPFRLPVARFHLAATKTSAGAYTCLYFVEESGREIPSDRSLPFTVKVRAAPAAPTLSLIPQEPLYRYGNDVQLLCSIPSSPAYVKEIQYYADFGFAVSIPVLPNVRNSTYHLRLTAETPSGSYSCAYFVVRSNRPVRSRRSPWIDVTVKGRQISSMRQLLLGGSFFALNGLVFCFSRLLAKRRGLEEGRRGP